MIKLKDYKEYWEGIARRVPGITSAMPVTIDEEMGRKIQALKTGTVTLFYIPPVGESTSSNPDAYAEKNQCVIFVMEKFDTQRRTSYDALETSQPIIEAIKEAMVADSASGCQLMRVQLQSLSTIPETKFYTGFAGWSLGFYLDS